MDDFGNGTYDRTLAGLGDPYERLAETLTNYLQRSDDYGTDPLDHNDATALTTEEVLTLMGRHIRDVHEQADALWFTACSSTSNVPRSIPDSYPVSQPVFPMFPAIPVWGSFSNEDVKRATCTLAPAFILGGHGLQIRFASPDYDIGPNRNWVTGLVTPLGLKSKELPAPSLQAVDGSHRGRTCLLKTSSAFPMGRLLVYEVVIFISTKEVFRAQLHCVPSLLHGFARFCSDVQAPVDGDENTKNLLNMFHEIVACLPPPIVDLIGDYLV